MGASAAGMLVGAQATPRASGKLKVAKLVYYRAQLRAHDLFFIEVHTDGGIIGIGEGTCLGRSDVVEAAVRWLEPYVLGIDPTGVENQWDRMRYHLSYWSSGIIPTAALSALDLAFWDIEGKRLGVPVWRLLGGPMNNRLRPYFTHWDDIHSAADAAAKNRSPQAYADKASEAVKRGWTAVKFSALFSRDESEQITKLVAVLAAMRKAIGDRMDICLEFSQQLNARTAIRMARALEPYHPLWMEEPLPREYPASAYGDLAARSPVPIATGEGILSRPDYKPLLDARGAAIIQPDVVKCGGITEIRKIANLAEVYGVEVAPHQCYGPVAHVASLAAMSVCRNFLIQEWEATDEAVFQELTNGTFPVQKDGYVTLPDRPGLGIEVNFAEFVKRYPAKNPGSPSGNAGN